MALRLYNDLAWLWPLWGDVSEYEAESIAIADDIKRHAGRTATRLLDMGCGGGKNDAWLKRHFDVTGIDLSEAMLAQARALNPECRYLQADMRDAALGCTFDAVFVNDALLHMTSAAELAAVFETAFRHLEPHGVMICMADVTKESFVQDRTEVSVAAAHEGAAAQHVTFIENHHDPDPADDTFEWTAVYLIRQEGRLRVEHDAGTAGLFDLLTWRRTLQQAGFNTLEVTRRFDGADYPSFINLKPE